MENLNNAVISKLANPEYIIYLPLVLLIVLLIMFIFFRNKLIISGKIEIEFSNSEKEQKRIQKKNQTGIN
jgi:Na+-transporting NADH:ubiquinone oxidoreductase subunit NqrF